MGIISNIFNKRATSKTNGNPQSPQYWAQKLFGGIGNTAAGVVVDQTSALTSTAVWRAVSLVSQTIGSLPLHMYERIDERSSNKAVTHNLYYILHSEPNPEQSAIEFKEMLQAHLLTWGRAHAEIAVDGKGNLQLWPLIPDRVSVLKGKDNKRPQYLISLPEGQQVTLSAQQVFTLRGLGYSLHQSYNVITLFRESLGLTLAAEEFGARFFGNGATLGGVLEHPGQLGEEAHKELRESMENRHQGLDNAHRFMILEEGMKYREIAVPPDKAQYLETRKFQITDVARIIGVPPHKLAEMDRATFCLPADVQVMTEAGSKSIADVVVGERVWSIGEWGEMLLAPVLRSVCSGEDEILEIKTTNRTIRANAAHRILVRKKYADPKPGVGGYQSVEWVSEYVPAGELTIGDTVVCLDSLPDVGTNQAPTRKVSVGFMEFCGLLLGDGNVRPKWGVSIARANDANYMDHYREVIKREFVSFGRNGNGKSRDLETSPVTIHEQERQTRFASVLAAEELTELGFAGNARSKRVPEWVFKLTPKLKLAFIRGYLDADGSVDKKGRVAFHSVNGEMLSQIRYICMSLGIPVTNMRHSNVKTKLPNGKECLSEIYTFTCSDPGKNRLVWSNDERYQERLMNGKPFDRKGRNYPRHGGKHFSVQGCSLSRIVSIEKQPSEPVYDLEVEGTHSFIANGVVVHNSNIEHQAIEFVQDTINPWCVRWEQALSRQLLSDDEKKRYYFKHNLAGLLRGDFKTRMEGYSIGRQNGWLSANDVRELEDMNPIEDGDIYLSPLNMAPSDEVKDEGKVIEPEANNKRSKERRAADSRQKTINAYKPLLQNAALEIIKRERADVMRKANKILGDRNIQAFQEWLREFYDGHAEFVNKKMSPLFIALADLMFYSAAEEVDLPEEPTDRIKGFTGSYIETYTKKHNGLSLAVLEEAIKESDPIAALEETFDNWETVRAAEIGSDEAVGAAAAFLKMSFIVGGVSKLIWRANPGACEFCQSLDGKVVGIEESFVPAGGSVSSITGDNPPLTVSSNVKHPPIHDFCNCYIDKA